MPTTRSYQFDETDIILQDAPTHNYVLRFRDLPDREKPRERILSDGVKQLSVAELVSLILNVGTQKEDVLAMSRRIIKEYGEKALMHETDPQVLSRALSIPIFKACQLVACFELGRRYYGKSAGRPAHIRNSKQAYEYLKPMGELRKEQLRGLYLNSRYQVVHDEVVSLGSLTANIVHPREVFQPAIEHGAVAVIIAHNHPSGKVQPSLADIELTDQLVAAGKLLGIELIDHIIVTTGRFVSLLGHA